jgi:hypothetical protein
MALLAFLLAFAILPLADTWVPGDGASGSSSLVGFIDVPRSAARVEPGKPLTIYGWVVDTPSERGSGIDAVEISLVRDGGSPVSLGRARVNQRRPDVARVTGQANALDSGFELDGVAPSEVGSYPVTARAHAPDMICDSSVMFGLFAALCFVPLAFIAAVATLAYAAVRIGRRRT